MQVDPIKLTLKAPVTEILKLQYDKLLTILAFKLNLRRYILCLNKMDIEWAALRTAELTAGVEVGLDGRCDACLVIVINWTDDACHVIHREHGGQGVKSGASSYTLTRLSLSTASQPLVS